ncbi:YqcI/YcgG family protein [Amycolatopsis sp. NBC_00345]|uniref:YqcI/YcgG family protein n=1 Tax=Amycolatopsis sp. NBC_00345 TaxID=2975955 RepID=UPI002E262C35
MLTRRLQTLSQDRDDDLQGPSWLGEVVHQFRENLADSEYPCNFGRTALKRGDMHLTWVDRDDPSSLPDDMRAFVETATATPGTRQPLAVFVEPGPVTESGHEDRFWSMMRYLLDHDSRPWPEGAPQDPADPAWEFCFHGESIFVFALSPDNRLRRSRNLCDSLVLIFQLRSVFTGIEVGTQAGDVARQRIRTRLEQWDGIGRHPSMGAHDVSSDEEWRQYFFTDADESPAQCPLAGTASTTGGHS